MSDRKEQDAVITKMMMKDGRFQEAGKEEGYRKNIRTGNKEKQTGRTKTSKRYLNMYI